jgi:hypothetical protein
VDKMPTKPVIDGGVAVVVPRVEVSSLPSQPQAPAGGSGGEPVAEGRGAMQAASQAIKKGDWSHAQQIYEAIVTRNPGDSEALSGLGDVARAQGDTRGAVSAYKRALAVNPSYLPALLGVADTEWAGGDRAGAQKAYREIADRFPEGTYPGYVKTRAEPPSSGQGMQQPAGGGATAPAPPPSSTAKPAAPADTDGL